MNRKDEALLQKIHSLYLQIERSSQDQDFPEEELSILTQLLSQLSLNPDPEIEKLAEISDHLHPQMSLRHFQNFLVPVERALAKRLRDDEFLITRQDRPEKPPQKFPLVFVLENLRSRFNVGSIYRLADGVGASEVHLVGYTPEPDEKTSLGAADHTETLKFQTLADSIQNLRDRKFQICALETCKTSTSLFDWKVLGPTALIVGNERFGLENTSLQTCDITVELPMSGLKNSLNVAQALSAAAFEWKRQWTQSN